MEHSRSTAAYRAACQRMPGGVNSPVRAFHAVEGAPPFLVSGQGARIRDLDGNEYIDYVGSWGPLILGHRHPAVLEAIRAAAGRGWTFGAPTEMETVLAERVGEFFPAIEKLRLVNSGTEASASAIRLARGATARAKILKFAGCYHGHVDALLVQAGSGALTHGKPSSAGIPDPVVADTLVAPFNDLAAAEELLAGGAVAAVLVEPVAGNMGVIPPRSGFLEGLRRACDRSGTLLILDEVMTGFRVAPGGAQELYGVRADLVTLGKIIGGGLPVGAYGGRRELMDQVAPEGAVYQAGTLSGNPLAVAAGLATLEQLRGGEVHRRLEVLGARLASGLEDLARAGTRPLAVHRVGSMLTLFFGPDPIEDLAAVMRCDTSAFARFHRSMLELGVYLPASQFEAWFVSAAHTESDIDRTLLAASEVLASMEERD